MAPLTDSTRLEAYRDALGNWRFAGYIRFELTETAHDWVTRELDNISLREVGRRMHEFVAGGGTIDEVVETRPEWKDEYEFHYDLRLTIESRPVYIETRLDYSIPLVPDESSIIVVNIHAP